MRISSQQSSVVQEVQPVPSTNTTKAERFTQNQLKSVKGQARVTNDQIKLA